MGQNYITVYNKNKFEVMVDGYMKVNSKSAISCSIKIFYNLWIKTINDFFY